MASGRTEPTSAGGPGPAAQGDAAIELDGLTRDFGDRTALAGVTARLEHGGTLAVLGPNGSGKTTLLRILGGLLRPSGGRATVLGAELPRELWRVRGRIGYLGHRPLLYRDLTALENLEFSGRLHGLAPGRAADRALQLLGMLGMERRARERVATFSAGMTRRVDICRAILHGPDLLLLDEPESNLDAGALEAVAPMIGPGSGLTRVVASHDRERALRGASIVLEMG